MVPLRGCVDMQNITVSTKDQISQASSAYRANGADAFGDSVMTSDEHVNSSHNL